MEKSVKCLLSLAMSFEVLMCSVGGSLPFQHQKNCRRILHCFAANEPHGDLDSCLHWYGIFRDNIGRSKWSIGGFARRNIDLLKYSIFRFCAYISEPFSTLNT